MMKVSIATFVVQLIVAPCSLDAFLTTFRNPAATTSADKSFWRLEYVDDEAVAMPLFSDQLVLTQPQMPYAQLVEREDSRARQDTVDMAHFESSFRGLTGPSKAGLTLAFLLSAAMVATSPELSGSSLAPTLEIPTAWLGYLQDDVISLFDEKLHIMASVLSPYGEATQAMLKETIANGNDLFQVKSFEFAKTLEQIEMKSTTDVLRTQTILSQWGDDIATTATTLLDAGLAKLASVRGIVIDQSQQIQRDVSSRVEEFRETVVPPLEQSLEEMKQFMVDVQKTSDDTLLRDGPILKSKLEVVLQQAEAFLQYQNAEIRRLGIEPALKASADLWDSVESETIREYSIGKQTALDLAFQITSVVYGKVHDVEEFKNTRVPEMSQKALDLFLEEKHFMQVEALRFQTETLPAMGTKIDSLSRSTDSIISNSRLQLENGAKDFAEMINAKYAALANDLRSWLDQFTSQVRSNFNEWKVSTDAGIMQQKLTYMQIYDTVNVKATTAIEAATEHQSAVNDVVMTTTATVKESVETFCDTAATQIMIEGQNIYNQIMTWFETGSSSFRS